MNEIDPRLLRAAVAGAVGAIVLLLLAWRRRRRRAVGAALERPLSLRDGLGKTRLGFVDRLKHALTDRSQAEARLAALEEVLLTADVGVRATHRLLDGIRGRLGADATYEEARDLLGRAMLDLLGEHRPRPLAPPPHVIMVSGVNGVGKTTSVAKLARFHTQQGRRVLLVAADTFRAAATDQLARWAERIGVDCVRHEGGKDPSAVVFDGLQAAKARGADVAIIDTAGRLHVKENLLAELQKVCRTMGRQIPDAPHESLLVIDATTGQNAIQQARTFAEVVGLTGIILTKIDGTAKGGVALAIGAEIGVPVHYVGFGEGLDDFSEFKPGEFVTALLDGESS